MSCSSKSQSWWTYESRAKNPWTLSYISRFAQDGKGVFVVISTCERSERHVGVLYHMHQIACWVGVMNQGCRFVLKKHLGKQTNNPPQMVPIAGSKYWCFTRVWRRDSWPHLQPCETPTIELMISLESEATGVWGSRTLTPPSGCFIGWIYPQPSSSGKWRFFIEISY